MKTIIMSIFVLALLTGCTESTEFGECIGLSDEEEPNLKYKISVRNAIWSFLAVETVIAPVLWATDFAKCPVARREK